MPGGVAPKFGSEKVSRYTGVSQLELRVSRYTVQLRTPEFLMLGRLAAPKLLTAVMHVSSCSHSGGNLA